VGGGGGGVHSAGCHPLNGKGVSNSAISPFP
jgi:hypothetical protein